MADATSGVKPTSFVIVPHALVSRRDLSDAGFRLLAYLLTFARPGKPEVWPEQETLAADLGWSTDKVGRTQAHLIALGLVKIARRIRDRAGKFRQNVLNVAAAMLAPAMLAPAMLAPAVVAPKTQTAELRSGKDTPTQKPRPSIPQICGPLKKTNSLPTKEQQQATQSEQKIEPEPLPGVVVLLTQKGMERETARRLYREHGEPRCRLALTLLSAAKNVHDAGAWLCRAIERGYKPQQAAPPLSSGAQKGQTGASSVEAGSEEWDRARARHLGRVPEAEFAQLKARAEKHLRDTCRLAHFSADTLAQKMAQAWRFQCEGKVRA